MRMIKTKLIIIIFVLSILFSLSANFVFSDCPSTIETPHKLRSQLRSLILGFLSNPSLSPYTVDEIRDLLDFYRSEKDKPLITNCDALGSRSNTRITAILDKTLDLTGECNDNIDNDNDGFIDFDGKGIPSNIDPGCSGEFDNDETNCGDNICEGGENFISCRLDCPLLGTGILFMKNSVDNAISFKDNGDVILKGTLQQNTLPVTTSDDEFVFRDSNSENVAIINLVTGNIVIKGTLNDNQAQLQLSNPPTNDFIVRNSNGEIVSYIDESGNFYLRGTLTENGNP